MWSGGWVIGAGAGLWLGLTRGEGRPVSESIGEAAAQLDIREEAEVVRRACARRRDVKLSVREDRPR